MLISKLPPVRGRLTANAPLGHMTWFGVGGAAEVLFKPADPQDLIDFITHCPPDIPVMVLGVASNLIIRDGGIRGVVIRMGREFSTIDIQDTVVTVGAMALDVNVAEACLGKNVTGLEFLSGIPGTIGGALRMNAGAYGGELKDILLSAEVLFRDGTVKTMTAAEMNLSYRHNDLPEGVIFLGATLQGKMGNPDVIAQRMNEIKASRSETQPIRSKTGGSTFANPAGDKRAWQLIDEAGCRGLKIGGAQMSELHCNFMLNTGDATAADLERLGEKVRELVYATAKVMLRWEIKRVGVPLDTDNDLRERINKGE
jgi:UDP-N-acetylmuramate dehydrogenase